METRRINLPPCLLIRVTSMFFLHRHHLHHHRLSSLLLLFVQAQTKEPTATTLHHHHHHHHSNKITQKFLLPKYSSRRFLSLRCRCNLFGNKSPSILRCPSLLVIRLHPHPSATTSMTSSPSRMSSRCQSRYF